MCNGEIPQISIKIGNVESDKVWLHYFLVTNTGHQAIRADDFAGPLVLSVSGKEKIVAVLSGQEKVPGLSLAQGEVAVAPRLINPGKTFDFVVVTERETPCGFSYESDAVWKWTGEIADTQISTDWDGAGNDRWQGPFAIQVYLTGFNIWIALFAALAFFFLTVEIIRLRWPKAYRLWRVISVIFVVSVANGENAASLLQPESEIWGPALVAFVTHVGLIVAFFAFSTFKLIFRKA